MTAAPALLFDLDETLVVDEAALVASFRATAALGSEARSEIDAPRFAEAVRRLARELWHTAPEYPWAKAIGIASGEALWGRLEGEGPELAALREWAPGYRQAAWEAGLTSQGVDDPVLASALARRFADERRSRMWTYPDADPVLADLARRHPLAIVTNGMPDLQREKLAVSGLERHFDAVIVSGELGRGKPDPAVFAAALDALGARAEGAVMVGDSFPRDVEGARAAGLRAVWIDRHGGEGDIRSLAELPALVS